MVNDLIDSISIKLDKVFGERYGVHSDEDITQGLIEPCFLILALTSGQAPKMEGRYFRENAFDIQYFPEKRGNYPEMHGVADRLYDALEYITLINGDLIRGTKMRYEIVDGVLHFFVNYNMFLIRKYDPELMGFIDVYVGIA